MDESQSSEHKEAYWRRVILKWVKCADLATSYDSIDLDTCYTNFRCKINVYCDVHESTVAEFLRAQFPDFELELNKENGIPKCDAVYVFSLMLYFSCIRHPIPYFQNIGKEFDVAYQQSMKAFLNSFVSKDGNQIVINRSFLDKAFQNAKPFANVLNDESCNRSVLSQQMITSTPIGKHEIKKPSPSTPKSVALEWKLKNLNALLEAAQSENISQDREIERLLQHVKELQEEKKMYQAKINILQLNETCACGNDLTNLPNPSSRITEQLQKQLESKDSVIEQLQEELSKLKESISTEMERYMTMKKQYGMLQEDNQRMKLAAEELKEEITMKETCNQNLFEIVKDLRRFISENHVQGAGLMESLESTFEFLDQSFKNMASDDSQGYDSENLASTVVDIKLKEKEHELEAMTKKTQELEHDLQAMTEDLNRQLERDKTLIKDLSCQMELQKQINLELSQKTVELRQALAEAEKDKSQLTEDLEKNKASVKDLSSQLAELDQKTAELQQALANTERGKLLLADDIEEFKAKIKELQSQLEEKVRVQIELNEKNIGLLQALAESEKGKSQLLDDLGKEKSKTADLNRRLEQVEKTKAFHEQSYANVSDEMVKQISALQLHLDQEKEKSDEINCQYVQVRRQADDLDKQCTKLMQKLAEDQNEIANLQQQLAAKHAKLNELCALHEEKEKSARQQADDLDKQCTKLRQKLTEGQNEIANLQQQLAAKDAKLNELCALHEEKEKSARQQADDLDKQCTKLRQKLTEGQNEIANLQQQLAAKHAKLNELCALHEEKEKSARQQADDLDKQCTKLRQKLTEGQNEIANLQQQLAAKHAKLNELCALHEEKEKSARQQADDLDKQCTKLRQKLAEDQNEIANLQQQLAAKDAKLNELRALHEEKEKSDEINCQYVQVRRQADDLDKQCTKLRQKLTEGQNEIANLQQQLAAKDAKLNELCALHEEKEKSARQQADDLDKQCTKLRQKLTEGQNEIANLQQQLAAKDAKLNELCALHEEKEKSDEYVQARQQADDLDKQCTKLRQKLAEDQNEIANLQQQLAAKDAKLNKLRALHEEKEKSARQQADDLDKQCTKLMQKLAEDQNEIANLQQQLAAKDAKLNELCALHEKEKSDEINCQYVQARQQADDLDKQCTKLRQKLAEDQHEIANLQQQLAAKDAKLNELCALHEEKEKSDEYVQARRQADDLDEQCTKLMQKLAEDQNEIANLQQQLAAKDAKLNELCALHEEKEKSDEYVQARQQADDLDKQCTKLRQKLAEDQNEIANLQQQLAAKDAKLNELCALHEKEKSDEINCQYVQARQQADDLDKQCTKLRQKLAEDQHEIANLQQQLAAKDAKLNELCALHEEKVKQLEKSCKDGEIFAMKLFRARHALTEKEELWAQERSTMAKVMEEKLRDARIEHDSKMAKMKDRMVELHKEGKTKLESDVQGLLLTVDGYKRKVENLEVRCAKLQQQLAEMNERNLEVRKENQLLQIRIKSMDEFGNDRKSVLLSSQANLRNNFKMEDEEGELFNNMYLADLKSGRCVSPGGPSTSNGGVNRFFELSQRNSMVLPHLRTNYVALEPDCDPPQDDTRENMSTTFDDSSTGLISRRKVSGITSYKRPGPPTPSKRAGRLSLTGALSVNGGGEVQYKEVLRDANANVAVTSGGGGGAATAGIVGSAADSAARTRRTKTPGKFKQMISSSSLLNNFQRDEDNASTLPMGTAYQQRCVVDSTPQAIPSNTLLRLNVVTNQKRLQRELLFDSNRCLSESVPPVNERTTVPLGTILECPLAKEEQEQVFADCNALGGSIAVPPGTAIRTTTDSYSFSSSRTIPSTVLDMTAAASTTTTTVTDTSFQHPYGCSRYNILRKQELRREKRRQLYDRTRKLVPKGKHCASVAISIGSPNVDVQHGKDGNVTTNQYEDASLYYGFTSVDMEDSAIPTVNYPLTLSTSNRAGTGTIPLFLLFAALIGMLAQLMLCLGDLDSNTLLRANGS
ncbi:putative leucine-rich repeat-containing protein DDB_G0290503 isoform X5 [Anopheles stephensi]|uniref:putative leucine-rich repeat-containing protein DDB_G0290503 isoform X5 n=1 Tax=Anopheles stephensi TaxID=30069 RepID=UPI00165885EC|nr:putative leucine-rich repeat-containing protein DDB_G0290503 isoform X5 [Anopheles stephensi]